MNLQAILLTFLLFSLMSLTGKCQLQSELALFQGYFQDKNHVTIETALRDATTSLDQAVEIQDPEAKAGALKNLGLLHLTRTFDYEKAMDLLLQSLIIEDSLDLKQQQSLSYLAISRVFEKVGDHFNSARMLEQALEIDDRNRDINLQAIVLNDLGKVKASMGKLREASDHYNRVLTYRGDIESDIEAQALINLGHVFTMEAKYKEALHHHKLALAISRSIGDKRNEAQSLNDIGEVYGLMGNHEKSLANHIVSREIRQTLSDKRGLAESDNNIALMYLKANKVQEAIAQALVALESGREAQAQDQIFSSCELLAQCYKALEDYKNALAYEELSHAIDDFMQNERHERRLLESQNRYLIGKKENQIEKLEALRVEREKQIASQKKTKNLLLALMALSVVIAILILFLYLFKRRSNRILREAKDEVQRQNLKLQELNGTKDKFFSIISHDLKGPLNSLTSFSTLLIDHTDELTKQDIQMLAKDLDKSVKNLFALLENLLEWSRSQTGNIDFSPEVFDLAGILESNKSLFEPLANAKGIRLVISNNPACLVRVHKHSINTVLRNLVSNAIKFTNSGGTVTLDVQTKGNSISVSVTDTGLGMRPEVMDKLFRLDKKYSTNGTANEKGTGLGLILCKDFVEKNGGSIAGKSEVGKGSIFTFSLPKLLSKTVVYPKESPSLV